MRLCVLILGLFAIPLLAADDAELRSRAAKALNLLTESNKTYYKSQACFSCHHQGLVAMALNVARERGVPHDEATMEWAARKALTSPLSTNLTSVSDVVEARALIDPSMGSGSILVFASDMGMPANFAVNWLAFMVGRTQLGDGSWFTTDLRPPQAISAVTATAVAARAVDAYFPKELEHEKFERLARARQWLNSVQPRSTEDAAYKLFGLSWTGGSGSELRAAAALVVKRQNADGGWGQLPGMASDAYSTGQSVASLLMTGTASRADSAAAKGVSWLLSNQVADGSWKVKTRLTDPQQVSPPYFESGFPHGKDQFVSAAGTAWGAMALLAGLPKVQTAPRVLTATGTQGEMPWMRTAAWGGHGDFAKLIAGGLDPNSANEHGTSMLMIASHDPLKVELLLSAGADANQKSKDGVTALLVASTFPGSTDSLALLLKKGAKVKPEWRVKNNANPLVFAAMGGDAGMVAELILAGAERRKPSLLFGIVPTNPVEAALFGGHVHILRLFAAASFDLNSATGSGLTPLAWAAIANRAEVVRTLLELGVKVDTVDSHKFTPLIHAVTVDHGDTQVVEALLESGAKPDKKFNGGPTALEQAQKNGTPAFVEALSQKPKKMGR